MKELTDWYIKETKELGKDTRKTDYSKENEHNG